MGARFRAVLFDKDGTLFDFAASWSSFCASFLYRLADGDAGLAARAGTAIGFDLPARRFQPESVVVSGTPDEIAGCLLPHVPGRSAAAIVAMMNEEAGRTEQVAAVALAPFLDGLRARGLFLGVATNDAEEPARAHLTAAGILNRFDFVAGFDSGHGAKPAPGQLLAFAEAVGVDCGRVVMVGDSRHDLIAGRAAGMATVGVLTGMTGTAGLAPLADAVLPDIGHLPAFLGH